MPQMKCRRIPSAAAVMLCACLSPAVLGGTTYWIELGTWCPDPPWGAPNLPFLLSVSLLCPGDLDGDGHVGMTDYLFLLAHWG